MAVAVDAVQPQGQFRKLQRHRVQVQAEDVAVGDVAAHLAQFVRVVRVFDAPVQFALLALQVALRKLVHRLVQEGGGTHRRFADAQVQDVVGRHGVRDQLAQGVLHQGAGQGFRRVVAGGFLPVAPRQAVDEGSLGMDAQLAQALLVPVMHPLLVLVLVQVALRDEEGAGQVVLGFAGLLQLVQVLLREEAAVGEQRFIDRAKLVDA